MARSSRSECHPEWREPPPLTLRSSHLTRHLRPLGQRRRGCQHLRQDLHRLLCVSTAPDGALGPSDLAVGRPSLAVDASLCICAIRGASCARGLPSTKSRRSSGSVELLFRCAVLTGALIGRNYLYAYRIAPHLKSTQVSARACPADDSSLCSRATSR